MGQSNAINQLGVTRKNRAFCNRHRKSPRLIRFEGTKAISRVVVKVGAVGRLLAQLAIDKVVRGGGTFQRMTIIRMTIC